MSFHALEPRQIHLLWIKLGLFRLVSHLSNKQISHQCLYWYGQVGTVGGGTQLAAQAACLDLLGVKGPSLESPGANSRRLATIIAGAVLGGELSLMSALASGQLVNSHMKYNRSSRDIPKAAAA